MRLTLRTLLAYLDDILDPAQTKEIGARISENSVASSLVARIREVTRRRRIASPELSGPGSSPDPNVVAEYLDNTLEPAAVAQDFHDAAPQCTDTLQRLSMESLAGQFSNASLSGSLKNFNLGKATSASMRSYAGQSSLTLLDYLNGNQGSDLTSQISGMMQSNLGSYLG